MLCRTPNTDLSMPRVHKWWDLVRCALDAQHADPAVQGRTLTACGQRRRRASRKDYVMSAVKGYVERHHAGGVSGWCVFEDEQSRLAPVTLGLYWGDVLLRTGYTNRVRDDIKRGWGGVEKAGFLFPLRDSLVKLLPAGTVLRVESMADHEPIPFLATAEPIGAATDDGTELRKKLAEGWHVDHWGAMKIPFGADDRRRQWYSDAVRQVADHFLRRYGSVIFPYFGTLLGYAREGRFLAHDDDVDTAFISHGHSLEDVASEFWMIARDLRSQGHNVDVVSTGQLNVQLKGSQLPGVDVFSAWVKPDGSFCCYPSATGRLRQPLLFKEVDLEGNRFIVPEDHEHFVEFAYGPSWRTPDPLYQLVVPREIAATMQALGALRFE